VVVCEGMGGRGPASAGRGAGWEPPPGAGAAHVVFEGRPLFAVDQALVVGRLRRVGEPWSARRLFADSPWSGASPGRRKLRQGAPSTLRSDLSSTTSEGGIGLGRGLGPPTGGSRERN